MFSCLFFSELFSLPQNGLEQQSESLLLFLFHGTEFWLVFSSSEGFSERNSESCFYFLFHRTEFRLFHGRVRNWNPKVFFPVFYLSFLTLLVGFGWVCEPMRSAHLSFWASEHAKRGAMCPPPIAASLLLQKIDFFQKQNAFLQAYTRATRGVQFSTGLSLTFTELHCTLLSYASPFWAMMHPNELRCTLSRYASPY